MTFQNTYEFFSESRPVFENCDFRISLQLEKPPEKPIFKHQSPGKIHTHTEELTAHSYTQKKMYEWFVGRFFFIDLWITWDDWYGKSIFSTSSMCLIFFFKFLFPPRSVRNPVWTSRGVSLSDHATSTHFPQNKNPIEVTNDLRTFRRANSARGRCRRPRTQEDTRTHVAWLKINYMPGREEDRPRLDSRSAT